MSFLRSLFTSRRSRPKRHPSPDPELTNTAAAWLREIGCDELAQRVAVCWSNRLSSSAGLARPSTMTVSLNPRLREFPAEVHRTLRHELAHLLAFARARRKRVAAHGPEWRQACVDLGIPGESRCHALPLPRRRVKRVYFYRCPGCGFILERARRINLRRRALACRDCCRTHARGRFDARFNFVEVRPSDILAPRKG